MDQEDPSPSSCRNPENQSNEPLRILARSEVLCIPYIHGEAEGILIHAFQTLQQPIY